MSISLQVNLFTRALFLDQEKSKRYWDQKHPQGIAGSEQNQSKLNRAKIPFLGLFRSDRNPEKANQVAI